MATYRPIKMDETLNIKGGEKFLVITKDGLMPDGRLRPWMSDDTSDSYQVYIQDAVTKLFDSNVHRSDEWMLDKLKTLFRLPDGFSDSEFHPFRNLLTSFSTKGTPLWTYREKQKLQLRFTPFVEWSTGPFTLQANTCSRAHKLQEEARLGNLSGWMRDSTEGGLRFKLNEPTLPVDHIFIVKHDWLGVLGGTNPELHEWELPFADCLFEFRVSGKTVILTAHTGTDNARFYDLYVELAPDNWISVDPLSEESGNLGTYVLKQVAACCVVLEAKIATHEVVRQPTALNDKRRKTGKLPLYDFHLLDLSRRPSRASPNPNPVPSGVRMRLHFVRGHWRQYPTHRVRIPWCLRGDPELGFVDKHYKL